MKKKKQNSERVPLELNVVDINTGLDDDQIAERLAKNYSNDIKIGTSKTYSSIIFGNIFSFFNMLCFAIFIWLITVIEDINGVKNLTFMVIITANVLIGIIQEIKAKLTMDKLSLLSSPDITVIRNGENVPVKLNDLLMNEIMLLSTGNQVCSDCIVREGEVEVNESLLTGESLPIKKVVGDKMLSGSFIVTGKCKAEIIHVAEQNYIQQLAMDAKKFKKSESELLHSIKLIMKIIGFLVIPIGILSFLTNWNAALNDITFQSEKLFSAISNLGAYNSAEIYQAYKTAVTPTSTALIGVIPAGLILLTSVALAVGVVRLAKRKALVRELYSIETLARVNMLCLDKTGTITDGTMNVKEFINVGRGKYEVEKIISSMQYALEDNNQTAMALINRFGAEEHMGAEFVIPFSSERKCSAVKFKESDLFILGAPEYVTTDMSESLKQLVNEQAKKGYRCLMLAVNKKWNGKKEIPKISTPISLIIIEDNVKSDAIETIKFFKDNGVDVRVISGDNPVTVSEVAKRVGINNADKFLSLQGMPDEELIKVALNYTVFGRVSPSQKKLLIQIFKRAGNTVAMTGDGINDILALKEADCSIAMANGSEATRNVAQLVLLDSNFSSMPRVVGEGRRVVNNIERASTLFLTKTLFSAVLQLILVFMGRALPLEPIQLSFMSFFTIGIPSFFLALEPNNKQIEGKFITNVGKRVLPGAIAVIVNVVIIMILTKDMLHIHEDMLSTVVMVAIYSVFMQILYQICKPFNVNRLILYSGLLLTSLLCIILMPLAGRDSIFNLFNIVAISDMTALFMIFSLILLAEFIMRIVNFIIGKFKHDENNKLYFDIKIDKNNIFNQ